MANFTRAPAWLPPRSLIAMALMIVLGSFKWRFLPNGPMVPLAVTGQAFLIVLILRAFATWPPMKRWFISMPIVHRVVFSVLILGMIAGHYTFDGRTYFPYVTWEIFPNYTDEDPVTCDEFIATTESGKKVRLLAEQLFPSSVQTARIEDLSEARWFPPDTTEHLARALAKVYNQQHPDNPVWRVDLMRLAVQLHPPTSESRAKPSCELLKRYDISSGQ
jgi:hypothetical protein